jgi:guanylate kinase
MSPSQPKNRLIVVSAPSGTGKTTLCARLLREIPELILSISTTTRAPRGAEREGVEYFFVSAEEFRAKVDADRFAEWAEVHGNFYGTSKDFIERAFSQGKSLLLDIDVQGADSLKAAYPAETVRIFLCPPSMEELERRLRARATDSEESISKRLLAAAAEMAHQDHFDHVIVNDDLERAYFELSAIVLAAIRGVTVAGAKRSPK